MYTPVGFVNSQASRGETRPREWRQIVDVADMSFIPNVCGSGYSNKAIAMCEVLKDYVNGEIGSFKWQCDHVQKT